MAGSKGSNSVQVRHYNERVVLQAIRRSGEASKAEIARFAHLTPPAVATIVDALAAAGLVQENGKRFGGKGQPSVMYGLAPNGAFSIGLHIGRRSLDAIVLDFAGSIADSETHEYDHPTPSQTAQIANAAIARFRKNLGAERCKRLIGVGVSAPYFIGGWDNELGFPLEVREAWKMTDIRTGFLETGGLPIMVENDASAAALAELVYGIGKTTSDFLHISLSTFVGGGLVLDGTLQTGPNGNTAAIGPIPVMPSKLNSVPAPVGAFEVLLHRASIFTLIQHLRFNGFDISRVRDLEPMPATAAALTQEWQDDCADALAQAIVSCIAVIDVDAIVIDGILPPALLVDTVERTRQRFARVLPAGLVAPHITAGCIGNKASATGAALLQIYSMFGPDTGVLLKKANDKKPLMVGSAP
ncbi:ROK family transcriptional regulator [Devosia epidermidihirudinis]|uniref:ROK family transcriptional regulator n=1 Tax=Devosia epidermidihirudinis TaxID=1293439 RepID=A0A0F5QAJ9_9HYPH|nr:ROK family transcriptional regulator [Devosia epidermidihirudinis]KKC37990.1 ROK family transcriptional regulator [Devosia epidermidihirudinis]